VENLLEDTSQKVQVVDLTTESTKNEISKSTTQKSESAVEKTGKIPD